MQVEEQCNAWSTDERFGKKKKKKRHQQEIADWLQQQMPKHPKKNKNVLS